MTVKKAVFFLLALVVAFAAGMYRWGDSAHSIGLIKASGGEARHPSFLRSGENGYTLIATATVIPPYRGDVRVELEGHPFMDHQIYLSGPVLDLGIRRHPELQENVIRGLQPMDRIALWVVMQPPEGICKEHGGHDAAAGTGGRYQVAFYDVKTNRPVLSVPVVMRGEKEVKDAVGHRH